MAEQTPEELVSDAKLIEAVNLALKYSEQAKTFRSKVGIVFEMYDGSLVGGFNIETYGHKGNHAEEVGLINAMSPKIEKDGTITPGYSGTDFKRMIEVYQDAGHDKIEVFPACPLDCWGRLNEFTHPYLEILVADITGKIRYRTSLKEMLSGIKPPAQVYPSNAIRKAKPKSNITPRLPLNQALMPYYNSDQDFKEYCDEVLKVRKVT